MARQRAKGGGRKPKPDKLGPSKSVRIPDDLRRLLTSAATANGRNESAEIIERLKQSFRKDVWGERDRASRALCYLIAELVQLVKISAFENPDESAWLRDPFAFAAVRAGVVQLLAALPQPKGKATPPKIDWLAPIFDVTSPEAMGHHAASLVLSNALRGLSLAAGEEDAPIARRAILANEYGFEQAGQDLRLKEKQS